MILGPVSLVDCLIFLLFLIPQLLLQAGLLATLRAAIPALPYLFIQLPIQFVHERFFTPTRSQSLFVRQSSIFEDIVIRCVRYAFRNIPTDVGRVFFSRQVALPFARWRMLRHGFVKSPVYWREHSQGEGSSHFKGVWIMHKPEQPPDIVIFYAHGKIMPTDLPISVFSTYQQSGGGFALGSCFFYLEFLLAWHHLLLNSGYKNPAIFALEYTLAPDDVYPKQIQETLHGYEHALDVAKDASRVCVAGDSAGATLILSLLQELGAQPDNQKQKGARAEVKGGLTEPQPPSLPLPNLAVLISPWVTLVTNLHRASRIDYLDRQTLWTYAHEYAGDKMLYQHPASPGSCEDGELWKAASPRHGYFITYGEEEVFAPDIRNFLKRQIELGVSTEWLEFRGEVHAWPVASLFLSDSKEKRMQGLEAIMAEVRKRFDKKPTPKVRKG
ncbi:hypothetical protein HJFPF1_03552 [Paramyrothecium foliicola]|nr:hypothetical protein HJFPF1_03552 [Paramyrothecium foliicola]